MAKTKTKNNTKLKLQSNGKNNDLFMLIYIGVVLFILSIFIVGHYTIYTQTVENPNWINGIMYAFNQMSAFNLNIMPLSVSYFKNLIIVIFFIAILIMYMQNEFARNRQDRKGEEYGSAKWTEDLATYNKTYTDPIGSPKSDGKNNIILTDNVFLSLKSFNTKRNLNIAVVGGSGAGKSRFLVKPNLLQANCSFVVTDPAGELLESMGDFLEKEGYVVKSFNLTDMSHSNCYNPFDYIRDDNGVLMLINCLIKNTTPPGKGGGDPFWEKSETALLQALFFYLLEEQPPENRNFTAVMKLLRAAEVNENDASYKSPLDRIFEDVGSRNPNSMAYKNYLTFKMGAGKTLKSILISCAVRLQAFDLQQVANLVRTDTVNPENNLDLTSLGDRKTALFVIIPAADDTYNFIVSMMYYQLFESLYFHAETVMPDAYTILNKDGDPLKVCLNEAEAKDAVSLYSSAKIKKGKKYYYLVNGSTILEKNKYKETIVKIKNQYKDAQIKQLHRKMLSYHVRFLLDEFANIGQIPDFTKKLATMRKYEISCTIILQNLAQLKAMYKDDWEGLLGNCDSFLYLGGQEVSTLEYVSKLLGKQTEVVRNNSRNVGAKGGASLSYNKAARNLMDPDEISKMDNSECILVIRGLKPFRDKKYDYPRHKNYIYTGDASDDLKYDYKTHFNNTVSEENTEQSRINKKNAEKFKNNSIDNKKIVSEVQDLTLETFEKATGISSLEEIEEKVTQFYETPNFVENDDDDDVTDTTEEWSFNTVD